MATKVNTRLANHVADALFDSFAGGMLEIRTGSQPASADASAPGVLLVEIVLPSPAFKNAVGGTKAKIGTWRGTAVGAGTAGWCRFRNEKDTLRFDGSVTMGPGGEIVLDNTNIAEGQVVTVNTGSATQPTN